MLSVVLLFKIGSIVYPISICVFVILALHFLSSIIFSFLALLFVLLICIKLSCDSLNFALIYKLSAKEVIPKVALPFVRLLSFFWERTLGSSTLNLSRELLMLPAESRVLSSEKDNVNFSKV
jgi:hypothetical protein